MSERGSFVTQYFYCKVCFEVCKKILLGKEKYLCSLIIPGWGGKSNITNGTNLPIIAGKIGGLYQGEEIVTFETELIPEIKKKICHPVRIAVLADEGEKIFTVEPIKK